MAESLTETNDRLVTAINDIVQAAMPALQKHGLTIEKLEVRSATPNRPSGPGSMAAICVKVGSVIGCLIW